ncbi:hypothetical protein [Aureliella helgolandensis]|uniref:Uncharacterized protein n=1 Tax=Aureliella helgolandensis TaxID=2527968 RepID=A0A518G2V5_9BACT|nr:hypothetical protein [Aureliella helgolandensis]QDV22885.1 hypothetical protein Q31a_11780 [Aureliella helgolandensis]
MNGNRVTIRHFLSVVRIEIICRGYTIQQKKAKHWNSWYLTCHRASDGRYLRVRVSDHFSRSCESVHISLHPPGGATLEKLRQLLK